MHQADGFEAEEHSGKQHQEAEGQIDDQRSGVADHVFEHALEGLIAQRGREIMVAHVDQANDAEE